MPVSKSEKIVDFETVVKLLNQCGRVGEPGKRFAITHCESSIVNAYDRRDGTVFRFTAVAEVEILDDESSPLPPGFDHLVNIGDVEELGGGE